MAAAAVTVLARPRVPWAEVWPLMQRERASVLALVPAILELILAAVHERVGRHHLRVQRRVLRDAPEQKAQELMRVIHHLRGRGRECLRERRGSF